MRTETITREIFTFDELSPEAQERAIDNNRYINVRYSDWSDSTVEYVQELCATFGLDIEKVLFSGFCSQGDGAMFVAQYRYKKGGINALAAYSSRVPEEVKTVAADLQELQKRNFYRIEAKTKHDNGHYYHYNSMDVDTWDTQTGCSLKFYENGAEKELTEILRRLARWVYRILESDYEDQTSDEAIKETIEANGYEFTADGERA